MATCSVVNCDQQASTRIVLHQQETFGRTGGVPVCDEHNYRMSVEDAPWAHLPDRGGILIGADLEAVGLLVVDKAVSHADVDEYVSGIGSAPHLLLSGRVHGSGEPRTVEVLLTKEAIDELASALAIYLRIGADPA